MGLMPEVLRAIKRKGYRLPTPIQRRALPLVLQVTLLALALETYVSLRANPFVHVWQTARFACGRLKQSLQNSMKASMVSI